ncbi:MAG: hypothetical protein ABJE47_10780 [bacterium]
MQVQLTTKYLLAFVCLAAILGIGHELAHHVVGFLICGEWGYKTFNSFKLAPGCQQQHPATFWLATLAGPVLFNYIPIWIGFFHMRRGDVGHKLFGLTLVFATIPIMRIVFSALHANDEPWMVRHFFGRSALAFWAMNVAIWLLTGPPLILAWRTIQNRHRLLLFLFYLLALPVFVFFVVGIVLENMILKQHILSDTVWGMPYLVLLAEALAYLGYHFSKQHLRLRGGSVALPGRSPT